MASRSRLTFFAYPLANLDDTDEGLQLITSTGAPGPVPTGAVGKAKLEVESGTQAAGCISSEKQTDEEPSNEQELASLDNASPSPSDKAKDIEIKHGTNNGRKRKGRGDDDSEEVLGDSDPEDPDSDHPLGIGDSVTHSLLPALLPTQSYEVGIGNPSWQPTHPLVTSGFAAPTSTLAATGEKSSSTTISAHTSLSHDLKGGPRPPFSSLSIPEDSAKATTTFSGLPLSLTWFSTDVPIPTIVTTDGGVPPVPAPTLSVSTDTVIFPSEEESLGSSPTIGRGGGGGDGGGDPFSTLAPGAGTTRGAGLGTGVVVTIVVMLIVVIVGGIAGGAFWWRRRVRGMDGSGRWRGRKGGPGREISLPLSLPQVQGGGDAVVEEKGYDNDVADNEKGDVLNVAHGGGNCNANAPNPTNNNRSTSPTNNNRSTSSISSTGTAPIWVAEWGRWANPARGMSTYTASESAVTEITNSTAPGNRWRPNQSAESLSSVISFSVFLDEDGGVSIRNPFDDSTGSESGLESDRDRESVSSSCLSAACRSGSSSSDRSSQEQAQAEGQTRRTDAASLNGDSSPFADQVPYPQLRAQHLHPKYTYSSTKLQQDLLQKRCGNTTTPVPKVNEKGPQPQSQPTPVSSSIISRSQPFLARKRSGPGFVMVGRDGGSESAGGNGSTLSLGSF